MQDGEGVGVEGRRMGVSRRLKGEGGEGAPTSEEEEEKEPDKTDQHRGEKAHDRTLRAVVPN